jgi:hypothetical protein
MRNRTFLFSGLIVIGLAAFTAYAIVIFHKMGLTLDGLREAWPYLAAGVLTVGAATGALIWLAFYSHRLGFDERMGSED